MPLSIVIVTIADDLHAEAIRHELRDRFDTKCSIVECDRVSASSSIDWSIDASCEQCLVRSSDGIVDLADVSLVWWRRARSAQVELPLTDNEAHVDLVNNDCRAALFGIFLSSFQGRWISDPIATERAGNKLVQLAAAKAFGFRIPTTLVSQDPQTIATFFDEVDRVILKPVFGTPHELCFTQFLTKAHLANAESLRISPAIYQEFIPGTRHVRLNCFGDRSYAAIIETDDLDWRADLNVPISDWPVPESLHHAIRGLLDKLNLEMGVVDVKLQPDDQPVFLEINPQGQFLFLEGLTGRKYTEIFAEYLSAQARASSLATSFSV